MNIEISPQEKSLGDLVSKIYSDSELAVVASFEGSIYELNEKYLIECMRKTEIGYRVSYCGESSLAVIIFDDSGQKLFGQVYKVSQNRANFDFLSTGTSVEDVQEMDPNGNYLFLYTGRNDTPKQSTHYTADGYLITIEYNEKYFVQNMESELI